MFGLFHLVHHSFRPNNQKEDGENISSSTLTSSSDPEKNLAVVVWWAAFGISLFFRPAFELALRVCLLFIIALSLGALCGFLNLSLGDALLKAARCHGYDVPTVWTMQAGVLGGITVIGPSLVVVLFILRGNVAKLIPELRHAIASFVLEIALSVAISAAAGSVGVLIVRRIYHDVQVLDAMRASRAGALGASIVSVVNVVLIVTILLCRSELPRKNVSTTPENTPLPSVQIVSSPASRTTVTCDNVSVRTVITITYYSLTILCILTVRLLCF
ncbi:hypothetical protein V8B97DRAFT_1670056 [Scleroderma yunnanense]